MFTTTANITVGILRKFRRTSPFPVEILLPGLLILSAWPVLRIWLDDERAAFMAAFVLGLGLRLAMKSDRFIAQLRAQFSSRASVILVLICGPGILALLIWAGDPILCQRFLSLYFLIAAALYIIDIADGNYSILRFRWPEPQMRSADASLSRAMVMYNLGMVLVNEAVIKEASQTTWLMYFAFLPLLSNIIRTALVRTVTEGLIDAPTR
jgi:hypothetical protein